MRIFFLLLSFMAMHYLAQAQSKLGTFKVRRGTESKPKALKDTTPASPAPSDVVFNQMPCRTFLLRAGDTRDFSVDNQELYKRYYTIELGGMVYDPGMTIESAGLSLYMIPSSRGYGAELYTLKQVENVMRGRFLISLGS